MAQKFLTNLDLNQNQLLNATFEVLATDPSSVGFQILFESPTASFKSSLARRSRA